MVNEQRPNALLEELDLLSRRILGRLLGAGWLRRKYGSD
jgi:hypothetical protein